MPAQGGTGGKGSGRDVRAGGAWFEVYAKDGISGVLSKLKSKVQAFSSFMKGIGKGLLAGGAALGAAPLGLLIGGANRLADIDRLSKSLSIPIERMTQLQFAADAAGVSVDEVLNNQGKYQGELSAAPKVDVAQIKAATAAQKEFKATTLALQLAMTPLLTSITPIVKTLAEFVRRNAGVVRVAGLVAAGLTALGFAALGGGIALAGLTAAGGALVAGLLAIKVGVLAILTPLGTLVAFVGGLGLLFATQTAAGQRMTKRLAEGFKEFADTAKEAWGGIVAAIAKGDLNAAFEVVAAGLKLEWKKVVLYWTGIFEDFTSMIRNSWESVTDFIAAKLADAFDWLRELLGYEPIRVGDAVRADAARAEADRKARQKAERDAAMKAAQDEVDRAKERFKRAVAVAKEPPIPQGDRERNFPRLADAIKGSFATPLARQQFGYGDNVQKGQLDQLRAINAALKILPGPIGAAVANNLKMG